ncbi:alcohol dehydrogenase catalytic domain-containing protein, partial [Stomatohabitans albus]|uniref:alcohol dehydrogenase catalytic domain-containing protein n=1 Tax=Stomatohabitans albus TaxID=3110766 RepID=UPI00300D1DC1
MRAWIFHGPGDIRLEDVPVTHPGPGEIKLAIKAAATCGTDLKTYRRGHPTISVTPSRFGHEPAGIVTEVGEGVTLFKEGDRVVCANTVPCGTCFYCSIDRESLCPNLEFLYGAFADELIVPAAITRRNTYHIPEHLSFAAVAPLEPLATVVHAIDQSGIRLGDTVVVNGAGPIGQMHTRLATARGAHVICVDKRAWRLDQA